MSIQVDTQKSPELRPPGIFYSVVAGWLMPQAGYRLSVFRKYILTLTPMFLYHIGVFKKRGEIMDESKLTPEELEEMEKQFWEIVRKYRPEIFEENESDTD